MKKPIKHEGIQINIGTIPTILDRFPSIGRNYTHQELLDLARKGEYVVTNPQPLLDFWIITEQDLMMNYGTTSSEIERRFVPLTPVK